MAAQAGPDLGEVETKDIAFQDVASTSGARLRVSQPWPEDAMPPVTASLLSIASKKGILAAAGPDSLVIASTEKVIQQYLARRKEDDEEDKLRDLQVEAKLSVPRVSHVAFSSDESCLVIAAQQGGGLAVYETDKLSNNAQPAFQIATNGTSVRHILPNPNPSPDTAHLFGVVLSDGKLLLADLKNRSLVNTQKGPVFQENVSCAAWSKLGKQIIAGLADSTCAQIDPQGNVKDTIPRPPQLQELQADYEGANALPVTSITWISNYEFLLVFSPSYPEGQEGRVDSLYFIARRTKTTPFTIHRLPTDPSPAFGLQSRTPSHHFLVRFTEWLNIKDMYIVSATSSTDIGVVAHFNPNQEKELPDEFVTANFPEERNQKAILPWNDAAGSDTSPIGVALDLGTKVVAPRPVYNEADLYPHSTTPLPALCVLGNDGILLMWWVIYNDAIKQKLAYPGMVHKNGRFAKYKKFNKVELGIDASNPHAHERVTDDSGDELDVGDVSASGALTSSSAGPFSAQNTTKSSPSPFGAPSVQPSQPQQPAFGQSPFSQPAPKPAFGQPGGSGFGATGMIGQKSSPWGTPANTTPSTPSLGHTFGQPAGGSGASPFAAAAASSGQTPAFGKPPQPNSTSPFSKPETQGSVSGFGKVSALGGTPAFGKPSTPSAFGQPSPVGGTGAFGQPSTPGASAAFGKPSTPSAFGKPSGLGGFNNSGTPFGSNASQASPFMSLGSNENKPNPFAAFANQKSPLSKETSSASTATIGSSFGSGSAFAGSSFASKPTISQESTMKDDDDSGKQPSQFNQPSGLGLGAGGFKLGSGFKGDGSAKDDLPMPKNPGGGLFGGSMFGNTLNDATNTKPSPFIKQEPGTEKQPQLKDIPLAISPQPKKEEKEPPLPPDLAKPSSKGIPDDAPLPPDPSTVSSKAIPDDAPLPPDPSTYKAHKMEDIPLPSFGKPSQKAAEKDFPIAASPPVDVTNSQTFSSTNDSEAAGPSDEGSVDWEDEDGEDTEADDDEESGEDDEEDDDDDDDDDEETEEVTIEDPARLNAFMNRITPASPKRNEKAKPQKTPESEEKTIHSSYTPAGVPPGPIFEPPKGRPILSPRSPSPRRAVTSPVRTNEIPKELPPQIKTSAIPPGRPVPRPAAPPKPREPTQGELEDELAAKLQAYLASPPEPTKDLPKFYTHADYEGTSDKPNLGGQIEKVFRDVNSMVDTVGLNAKALENFLVGQEQLRKEGQRTREELDDEEAWCLGDIGALGQLMDSIDKQLARGKLDGVRRKIEDLNDEQKELLRLKIKTTEMRKHIAAHTDAERLALQEAAPLSAETQAQQSELRQGVQRVQALLSEVEQKMTMLRADLASLSNREGEKKAVPTVEAVTNTILKMTNMIEQKSGDIDVLEAQIKRLPNGIASLRMADDYEDDLTARLANNRLLTASTSTPPRRPRMAANGDALGMSAMFGTSRFQTPPSGRFTPGASALGRSGGSLGASTSRKKMVDVTVEEVEGYYSQFNKRASVLRALQGEVEKRGARVVKVE